MECKFCSRTFSKGEHLRRHERTHTGAKPFNCQQCRRAFNRQDSLMRHEKLHSRPAQTGSSLRHSFETQSKPATPESLQSSSRASNSDIPNQSTPDTSTSTPPWPEFDFELVWPDAEELYQSINSDGLNGWQLPPGTVPLPFTAAPTNEQTPASSPQFDEAAEIAATSGGGGDSAVQGVSDLIANLSSSVSQAAGSNSINSTFLDESLHMFFVKFVPTFPVLHRSTFVFRDCLYPLLLNAIAIGSLYLGPKESVLKGEALWKLSHTAIATSWQKLLLHRGPYDSCSGVQLLIGMLLGKMYGILSRNRDIRTTAGAFHSLGFFIASNTGMIEAEPYDIRNLPPTTATQEEKEEQFRIWVALEMQRRAILAHYILDGVKSHTLGESTAVRHVANQLSFTNEDALFEATTADEWLIRMYAQQTARPALSFCSVYRMLFAPQEDPQYVELSPTVSTFTVRVLLEGIQSIVADSTTDDTCTALGMPSKSEIRCALARVYESIATNFVTSPVEKMETCLRWHGLCLDTIINSSMLRRYLCTRHRITQHVWSNPKTPKEEPDLIQWAHSSDGRRALLHAIAIQEIVEQLPRGRAHAMHMPSSLFAAATIYCVFAFAGLVTIRLPSIVSWRDALDDVDDAAIQLAELAGTSIISETTRFIAGDLLQNNGFGHPCGTRNVRYELNSIQKLFGCLGTQWGIAKDMEEVISQWNAICH